MKTTVTRITRVHAVREDIDSDWPEVKPLYDSPSFFIRVSEITVEYDNDPAEPGELGFMQAEIAGERFRRLKAGPKSTVVNRGIDSFQLHDLIRRLRWDR